MKKEAMKKDPSRRRSIASVLLRDFHFQIHSLVHLCLNEFCLQKRYSEIVLKQFRSLDS